jgi:hypothetical protein
MRPNIAQDAPPTEISVGGISYPVNVDFRVWLDVLQKFREISGDFENPQALVHDITILADIQRMVFGHCIPDADFADVLHAVLDFSEGYPSAPKPESGGGGESGPQTVSFNYDLNYIILAIRNQSGIDLTYRRTEPFHWWEFLLEYQTLCGDHYILNLIEARSYKGKDKDLLRRKRACALPVERTAAEQAEIDAFNALFEGGNNE